MFSCSSSALVSFQLSASRNIVIYSHTNISFLSLFSVFPQSWRSPHTQTWLCVGWRWQREMKCSNINGVGENTLCRHTSSKSFQTLNIMRAVKTESIIVRAFHSSQLTWPRFLVKLKMIAILLHNKRSFFYTSCGTERQWLALSLHTKKVCGLKPNWGLSCVRFAWSPCVHGFHLSTLLPPTDHSPKTC